MSEYCKNCYELQEKYDKMVKIAEENLIKQEELRLKNLKYKTALEEIKEIAENRFCSCNDDYCDLQRKSGECNDSEPCNSYLLRQIAKKITEAIGE